MEDFSVAESGLQPVSCSSMPFHSAVSFQPFSLFLSCNSSFKEIRIILENTWNINDDSLRHLNIFGLRSRVAKEHRSCLLLFMSTTKPVCYLEVKKIPNLPLMWIISSFCKKENLTLFWKSFPFQMCPKQTYELCRTKEMINYVSFPL